MDFILGNQEVLDNFKKSADAGNLSHAYIIEGTAGSGRLTLARAISATLICQTQAPCYSCSACKKIMQGVHQDVIEISSGEDSSSIKIDAVRELIKEAYIKPAECDKKIFIIKDAQKMVPAAQNALLQVFEEPPKNVMFFLLVTNRNLLLSTLKSRAVTIKTEKFSDSFVREELLKRYDGMNEMLDEAVILADGALGRAIELMESEEKRNAVITVKNYFEILKEKASYASLSSVLSSGISANKQRLFEIMTCFSLALRDIITFSECCFEKTMFFSDKELLSSLSQRLDSKKLLDAYDKIYYVLRDYSKINVTSALSNINMTLADDFS